MQFPFNGLNPLLKVSIQPKKGLKESLERCKSALFHLNGYLDAFAGEEQEILLHLLHISDSKFSFDLEGLFLSHQRLFEAFVSENRLNDIIAKQIIDYTDWFQTVKTLNLDQLEPAYLNRFKRPGDLYRDRRELKIQSYHTNLTLYTTPNLPTVIKKLKSELDLWIQSAPEVDPLIHQALGHFQIRALSPFTSFNGHVARTYSKLALKQLGLDYNFLPLAGILVKEKEKYNWHIRETIISNDYYNWCVMLIDTLSEAAEFLLQRLKKIQQLNRLVYDQLYKYTAYNLPATELNQVLFSSPFIKAAMITEKMSCHRHTAYIYIEHLVKMGLLIEKSSGREKLYYHREFLDILSAN